MIVTRFAPSPTGLLHVGNLRAALFNWALARKAGGRFILRSDDTDRERSRPEYADTIRRDLEWAVLDWDAELHQSARTGLYEAAAEGLRREGYLYPAWETPEELALRRKAQLMAGKPPIYDRAALRLDDVEKARLAAERPAHWRFLLSRQPVVWQDGILGPHEVDTRNISDPVLIRADGVFLYTLASVVDDAETGVSDIVRGADHVTNTAVQIEIFRALGHDVPRFAHHSLLVAPGGAALSKREGATSVRDLRAAGVEPIVLLSLLARLGTGAPMEIFDTPMDIARDFDLSRFGAAPTVFDPQEARRWTEKHLASLNHAAVAARLAGLGVPDDIAPAFWEAVRHNLDRFERAAEWWAICRDGAEPLIAPEDADFIETARALLPERPWDETSWKRWTEAVKQATGRKGKALYRPLRRYLTGRDSGPEMAKLMPLMRAAPR